MSVTTSPNNLSCLSPLPYPPDRIVLALSLAKSKLHSESVLICLLGVSSAMKTPHFRTPILSRGSNQVVSKDVSAVLSLCRLHAIRRELRNSKRQNRCSPPQPIESLAEVDELESNFVCGDCAVYSQGSSYWLSSALLEGNVF